MRHIIEFTLYLDEYGNIWLKKKLRRKGTRKLEQEKTI